MAPPDGKNSWNKFKLFLRSMEDDVLRNKLIGSTTYTTRELAFLHFSFAEDTELTRNEVVRTRNAHLDAHSGIDQAKSAIAKTERENSKACLVHRFDSLKSLLRLRANVPQEIHASSPMSAGMLNSMPESLANRIGVIRLTDRSFKFDEALRPKTLDELRCLPNPDQCEMALANRLCEIHMAMWENLLDMLRSVRRDIEDRLDSVKFSDSPFLKGLLDNFLKETDLTRLLDPSIAVDETANLPTVGELLDSQPNTNADESKEGIAKKEAAGGLDETNEDK